MKITRKQLRKIIREASVKNSLKGIGEELADAGLSVAQVNAMEAAYKNMDGDIMEDDDAFDKMFNYYMDTAQMPYEYAQGKTATPDEWILMHWEELESVGMGFYPQDGE